MARHMLYANQGYILVYQGLTDHFRNLILEKDTGFGKDISSMTALKTQPLALASMLDFH
jgi:hypothetical protein